MDKEEYNMKNVSKIQPTKRNIRFNLKKSKVKDWKGGNIPISQFFNAMSLFFPEGERFFIRSVRHFKNQMPKSLLPEISNFIGQEAFHGREHDVLNQMINDVNDSKEFEDYINNKVIPFFEKNNSGLFNLAGTVALEHLTATLAGALLDAQKHMKDADPEYRRMWLWHAIEETEHKGVAYDVYQEVVKDSPLKGYAYRSSALIISTTVFLVLLGYHYGQLLYKDRKDYNIKDFVEFINFAFMFKPGILRKAGIEWFSWFIPNFHPWNYDNSHHLDATDAILGVKYTEDGKIVNKEKEKVA